MLEDGYANLWQGTTLEVGFAPGAAVNGPGADLVLFDARFDAGAYSVSTSFDNFTAVLVVGINDFVNTGETRTYWVEPGDGGTVPSQHSAQIYGAPIDLTALGVPAGAGVSAVRFTALDFGADPIGLASLVPEPLSVTLLCLPAVMLLRQREAPNRTHITGRRRTRR